MKRAMAAIAASVLFGAATAWAAPDGARPQCDEAPVSAVASHPVSRTPRLGLQIFQNGQPVEMRMPNAFDERSAIAVTLHRTPFEIRAPRSAWNSAHANAGLAIALDDEPCFASLLHLRASEEDTPFFGRFRAMADYEFGAGRLVSARGRDGDYGYNYIVENRFNADGEGYRGLLVSRLDRRYSDTEDLMQDETPVTMVFYLDRGTGRPPTTRDRWGEHDVIDVQEIEIVRVTFVN